MGASQPPKAKVKWPVLIETGEHSVEGVTYSLSSNLVFIRCVRPLRLHEECDITINPPDSDRPLKARVEVVWSNLYGPDDDIGPRGMGVLFLNISDEDRKFISKEVRHHLENKKVVKEQLQHLNTLVIDESEVRSQAA